jgi:glycosyltransferase involved in cell wall biosynthesis
MSAAHQKVTIGVLNFNGAANIPKAIERLRAVRYGPIEEIIVLDNASTDESLEILANYGRDLRVIQRWITGDDQ